MNDLLYLLQNINVPILVVLSGYLIPGYITAFILHHYLKPGLIRSLLLVPLLLFLYFGIITVLSPTFHFIDPFGFDIVIVLGFYGTFFGIPLAVAFAAYLLYRWEKNKG